MPPDIQQQCTLLGQHKQLEEQIKLLRAANATTQSKLGYFFRFLTIRILEHQAYAVLEKYNRSV